MISKNDLSSLIADAVGAKALGLKNKSVAFILEGSLKPREVSRLTTAADEFDARGITIKAPTVLDALAWKYRGFDIALESEAVNAY